MKYSKDVSSSRRKCRKAHFTAPSGQRRIMMSAPLSKKLQATYNVKKMPIRKEDEVRIVRGSFRGREGKIINVVRSKFHIHVDCASRDRSRGLRAHTGIHPSNVVITKLYLDNDRRAVLARKGKKTEKKTETSEPATKASVTA